MSERVEQRGFPRVRVSHQSDHTKRKRLTRPAARGALAANRFNGFLNFADAIANAAAIRLKLLLSRTARSNSSAKSGKLLTPACEAG